METFILYVILVIAVMLGLKELMLLVLPFKIVKLYVKNKNGHKPTIYAKMQFSVFIFEVVYLKNVSKNEWKNLNVENDDD